MTLQAEFAWPREVSREKRSKLLHSRVFLLFARFYVRFWKCFRARRLKRVSSSCWLISFAERNFRNIVCTREASSLSLSLSLSLSPLSATANVGYKDDDVRNTESRLTYRNICLPYESNKRVGDY